MEHALGVLGWTPEIFWKSTLHELLTANRGYIRANKVPNKWDDALTKAEFDELKEKIEQVKAKKEVS